MEAQGGEVLAGDGVVLGMRLHQRVVVVLVQRIRTSAVSRRPRTTDLAQHRQHLVAATATELEQQERVAVERLGEDELHRSDMRARMLRLVARAGDLDFVATPRKQRCPALREHPLDVTRHLPRQQLAA